MAIKNFSDRISYRGQSSGEYYIYVDGKFWGSSDNYHELMEDIKDIEKELEEREKKNGESAT